MLQENQDNDCFILISAYQVQPSCAVQNSITPEPWTGMEVEGVDGC
jgi:hypothetical protein